MDLTTSLIVFAAIVITVNNLVLFYVIRGKGLHAKMVSPGMSIFLISLIEIVAIGIWGYIHLRK